jgi:hypothetical protein
LSIKEVRRADIPFNEVFQMLIDKLYAPMDPTETTSDRLGLMEELMLLSNDFVSCAKRYGKIIISENGLPVNNKTIKPAKMGGVIGGQKFVVQGILFKFAIDAEGVFGKSDYAAAKVAGLEMSAVASCFRCGIKGIHYPLTALLDYKGYRLIASSLLSLEKGSLVYGTEDACETVKNTRPDLSVLVEQLGTSLNVKKHTVLQRSDQKKVTVYSAADVEGHVDAFGRFYLLDLSRTNPPVRPASGATQSSYLYQHFRSQFVQNYPIPLSSDAYSNFERGSEEANQHKREINAATEYLICTCIPNFARELCLTLDRALTSGVSLNKFRLTELLHSNGINVRYLGLVAKHCEVYDYQTLLLAEMAARVVKNDLRSRLRKCNLFFFFLFFFSFLIRYE